jgi:uncharacterized protein
MSGTIVALYAAALTVLFLVLSIRTIRARRGAGVAIGTGESASLARAARAHANFAEYAPLALLLMLLQAFQGAADWWLHLLGVLLVAGRIVHAWGISQSTENFRFRVAGMVLTFTVLGGSVVGIVWLAVTN